MSLGASAQAQLNEIGPAPISRAAAHQEMQSLLDKVDPGNRQETIRRLSDLTKWYRDILDHWCPVKCFAKTDKCPSYNYLAGFWTGNDLNCE